MENISDIFENYKIGDLLDVFWDRGMGELNRLYFYYGKNSFDDTPLLIDAFKFYQENEAVFFSLPDCINIKKTCCVVPLSPFHDPKYASLLKS
jgi:hypothetical protein